MSLTDKPIICAEMTTNHMGNLNVLLKMVEAAKASGATIIKMQKKDVESFYTQDKLDSKYTSPYGKTYRDYRSTFEFNLEDFYRLDNKCNALDIPWYTTVQDVRSFDFFKHHFPKMPMVKLASCNARNKSLWSKIKQESEWPVVISIGGQSMQIVDEIVDYFNDRHLYIQQCTSTYPCPINELFLGNITTLKSRYEKLSNVHIGYSGHELGYVPTIMASMMGAEIIERHFCLSRDSFVHHIECSLEPSEFKEMVSFIRNSDTITKSFFGLKESERKFLETGAYGTNELKEGWGK